MADIEILSTVRKYADKLGAVLYERGRTKYPRQSGPQRYLFLTAPQDIRAWQHGDDINLVCLTDNRAVTFWSYVAEIQNDESFTLQCNQWSRQSHLDEICDQYTLDTLPGAGVLSIQHTPIPPHFDIALVDADGIPNIHNGSWYRTHAARVFRTVFNAVEAQENIDVNVLEAYTELRNTWAEPRGLFSKHLGPLDASLLLKLILDVPAAPAGRKDFVKTFCEDYKKFKNVDRAILEHCPATFLASDFKHVATEAQRYLETASTPMSLEQHTAEFARHYQQYILLEYRSWSSESSIAAWNKLVSHTRALRRILSRQHSANTRAWPIPLEAVSATADEVGLNMLIAIDQIDSVVDKAVASALVAYTHKHCDELETESAIVSVRLLKGEVAGQRPIRVSELLERDAKLTEDSAVITQASSVDGQKLRTAGQTLSRLRWDPVHRSKAYEVGYTDRFDGLKWMPLEQWGKPIEDEDFIPEHRIQLFRQKSNGQVLWDRAKKLDLTGQR